MAGRICWRAVGVGKAGVSGMPERGNCCVSLLAGRGGRREGSEAGRVPVLMYLLCQVRLLCGMRCCVAMRWSL